MVVGAEADAKAARRLAFLVFHQLNARLVVLALAGGFFDDLAPAPMHFEWPGQLSWWGHEVPPECKPQSSSAKARRRVRHKVPSKRKTRARCTLHSNGY